MFFYTYIKTYLEFNAAFKSLHSDITILISYFFGCLCAKSKLIETLTEYVNGRNFKLRGFISKVIDSVTF